MAEEKKRGRGRPKLTDEERAESKRKKAELRANVLSQGPGFIANVEELLTKREQAFVREYVVTAGSAKQAVLRACGAKSDKAAEVAAGRYLKNPNVQAAIRIARAKLQASWHRTTTDILNDVYNVGRAALENGDFKSALKALELEGKQIGMFADKVQVEGQIDIISSIEEGRERVIAFREEIESAKKSLEEGKNVIDVEACPTENSPC